MPTITTPELARAAAALNRLIEAADQGGANVEQGRLLVSATNGQCRVIKTDLDRRLADGKLREMEAKVISGRENGDDSAMPAISPNLNVPLSGGAAALLRAAADMLERENAAAGNGERSDAGQNAGSASAMNNNGNRELSAA